MVSKTADRKTAIEKVDQKRKKFTHSLVLFHRALRLEDNTALIAAQTNSNVISCVFTLTPTQIDQNEYKSENALQFMHESLVELDDDLNQSKGHLNLFYGEPSEIVERTIEENAIDAVFANRDYTPYAIKRSKDLKAICKAHDVAWHEYDDYLLIKPENIKTQKGTPYKVFTPFYKKAIEQIIPSEQPMGPLNLQQTALKGANSLEEMRKYFPDENENLAIHGGRSRALAILNNMEPFNNYPEERDIPALNATTHLSAHLKFGTISIREAYHAIVAMFGPMAELLRQLFWRDFFTHIGFHFPHVFQGAFREKYNDLKWVTDHNLFDKWCNGKTGFPIIDAGMRELNASGYMHNRVRMLVSSFLVKDLHINWQWGERYFARQLVDYDPCVNNGNWQWAASTGCDAQPYFRIFNPWSQQKKNDPECSYIKKWIPELREYTPKQIHRIKKTPLTDSAYPKPICDHTKEAARSKLMFKGI